jgi:polyisoprenyl-teichoic acid--peptidoglycan teichoic acid transferase
MAVDQHERDRAVPCMNRAQPGVGFGQLRFGASRSPTERPLPTESEDPMSNPSPSRRRQRARRAWLAAAVASTVALPLLVPAVTVTAEAATKTTTKKKVKTTTTKRRKPPAPAKGSKKAGDLWQPNGRPPVAALNFDPNPPSKDLANPSAPSEDAAYKLVEPTAPIFSILIIGTDARPNERPDKTRGDSIHVFTYNPALKKASLVGFPRDSYVKAPSGEMRKINEIMSTAGPDAFLATVNGLTGLNTKRYILTGFDGFKKIVDGVGGLNVPVDPSMNDPFSGAQFAKGWFQFNGNAALAFARARKTLPRGDFDRSANQAKMMVYGFERLRESTDNIRALLNWVLVVRKNSISNVKATEWMYLAQIARSIPGSAITSKIVPGAPETIDGSDVIRLDEAAMTALAADLADGVLGN